MSVDYEKELKLISSLKTLIHPELKLAAPYLDFIFGRN